MFWYHSGKVWIFSWTCQRPDFSGIDFILIFDFDNSQFSSTEKLIQRLMKHFLRSRNLNFPLCWLFLTLIHNRCWQKSEKFQLIWLIIRSNKQKWFFIPSRIFSNSSFSWKTLLILLPPPPIFFFDFHLDTLCIRLGVTKIQGVEGNNFWVCNPFFCWRLLVIQIWMVS